jgi:hypothetical protein
MIVDILFLGFWVALLCFIVWYLFFAKTYQSISKDELAVRWKIHKGNSKCVSKKIEYLTKKNEHIYGFKCGCGFEFKQKRLITQKIPK